MSIFRTPSKGRRAGRRISRWAESRRILSRAADLKFPTHRRTT